MEAPKLRLHADTAIMTAASLTLAVSLFFLFQDGAFFQDGALSDLKPVGTFKTSQNDVRRRTDSGMTWSNIDAPDSVFEGDSVFTGDKSEASITLDNGNTIKIDAMSLVVIHTKGNRTEIDLQYGSLQGKIATTDPILITQGGKSQKINGRPGSQIRIVKRQKEKAVRVQVTKGEVNVESQPVHVDEVVRLSDAKPVVEKSTITLISPQNGDARWLAMGSALKFKWKTTGASARQRMQVQFARDNHFDRPFYTADASGDQLNVTDSLIPDGSFYWRVLPAEGEPSLSALVTAFLDVPPTPVLPTDAQAYSLDTENGETLKTVFFTWEDKAGSIDFVLELAKDKDFKQIVKTKTAKEKVERVVDLPVGDYFWHVKGRHPERENSPQSRLMSFSIRAGTKTPKVPELSSLELIYTIPEAILARVSPSQVREGRGVKPEGIGPLTWTPVENAHSYEVEVALDTGFTNSVRYDNGASTSFVPKEVRPGSLYMRVLAVGTDGRKSLMSKTAKLSVWLPPPVMKKLKPAVATFKSEVDLQKGKHEFALAWKPQMFASSYQLQWGADSEFTKSKSFKLTETSRNLKVTKAESYAARVRSLDADGAAISPYSAVEIASYKKDLFIPPLVVQPVSQIKKRQPASPEGASLISALPPPQLTEPAAQAALVSLEDAPTFVTFKWKPFRGAAFYTIQISSDADFTKIVGEKRIKSNGFIFQRGLPEGRVFWRVRAHTPAGFSNWSDPSDINVLYQ